MQGKQRVTFSSMLRAQPCDNQYHLSARGGTQEKTDTPKIQKHWHLVGYIIVRQSDVREVLDTRTVRGPDCGTEHVVLRIKMKIIRKMQCKKSGFKPPRKLDTLKYQRRESN